MSVAGAALRAYRDVRRARREGPDGIADRQRRRVAELVSHVRAHSRFYADLYRDVPPGTVELSSLPATSRTDLMARFDDWVTDRRVTSAAARSFLADPQRAGTAFLGEHLLVTSSGTTGEPVIIVQDRAYDTVSQALQGQLMFDGLGVGGLVGVLLGRRRVAAVFATGGHYVGYANAERARRSGPGAARRLEVLSVQQPLRDLVAALNRARPAAVVGYAGVLARLAEEQESGRLAIRPLLVVATAEGLAPGEYPRLSRVFGARVQNLYGCSEFAYIAAGCAEGWLHVNADWVVVEPVDAEGVPVAPGVLSETALLTNLANRVQPLLRYDLGDRVLARPDPCVCGSPLPAIKVSGRSHEVLEFSGPGGTVALDSLVLTAAADAIVGVDRYQLEHRAPNVLRVRVQAARGAEVDRVKQVLQDRLTELLRSHGLEDVRVDHDPGLPQPTPGGKYRRFVPLAESPSRLPAGDAEPMAQGHDQDDRSQ